MKASLSTTLIKEYTNHNSTAPASTDNATNAPTFTDNNSKKTTISATSTGFTTEYVSTIIHNSTDAASKVSSIPTTSTLTTQTSNYKIFHEFCNSDLQKVMQKIDFEMISMKVVVSQNETIHIKNKEDLPEVYFDEETSLITWCKYGKKHHFKIFAMWRV